VTILKSADVFDRICLSYDLPKQELVSIVLNMKKNSWWHSGELSLGSKLQRNLDSDAATRL